MKFYPLTVTKIEKTIRNAVVLSLKTDAPDRFKFTQGQYLTFRRDFDGEELRRSYSICSGKGEDDLKVGIKQVEGGAFSTWANTELVVGDVLEALPPMGNFYSAGQESKDPHYLAFAAGSGITPILSIIRTGLEEEPTARFTLIYSNKNPNTIMFREDLEDLKNDHMGRFNVIHILSDNAQEIDLFKGRVDAEKCRALFDIWIDADTITTCFICGPEPMMKTVAQSLEDHGLGKEQIRYELFASKQQGRAKTRAVSVGDSAKGIPARVTLGGETRSFTLQRDVSLLDAAIANSFDAPYACKAGVCSTCKAKVIDGEVEMVANHALEDYEVEAGFVLTCQCFAVSDSIVWDYDESGH